MQIKFLMFHIWYLNPFDILMSVWCSGARLPTTRDLGGYLVPVKSRGKEIIPNVALTCDMIPHYP